MPTAFSYIRFSTVKQAEGDSLRRQTELRDNWLKRNPDVRFDTSLTLKDLGVSAFHGDDRAGLKCFLKAIETKRVKPGDYLLLENLDRLSREDEQTALQLLLNITQAGVWVVQLEPELLLHKKSDVFVLMRAIFELSRGHNESKMKSFRGKEGKRKKRQKAIENKTAFSGMCPHWLTVEDEKYVPVPENAALVKRCFKEILNGVGVGALCRKLNNEKIRPFGRARRKKDAHKPHRWQKSSLGRMLRNRAVIGEYQATEGRKLKPVGEPVKGFYPALISEGVFARVGAILTSRRHATVGERKQNNNMFAGLVHSEDRTPWTYRNKGANAAHLLRRSDDTGPAIHYDVFEEAIFSCLSEITPDDLTGRDVSELEEMEGRLLATEGKITTFEERMYNEPTNTTYPKLLERAKMEREKMLAEVTKLRLENARPVAQEFSTLQKMLGNKELREKLKTQLALVIANITIEVFSPSERYEKMVILQFSFRNTDYVRNMVYYHRCARKSRNFELPEIFDGVYFEEKAGRGFRNRIEEFMADFAAVILKHINKEQFAAKWKLLCGVSS